VTRGPSEGSQGPPIQPRPTVPVGTRKRAPDSRVQTQVGIGSPAIDHAAAAARRDLASSAAQVGPTREEESGVFASGHWVRDAAPVVLPLRREWIVAWTAISLALVPLSIWAMLALASSGQSEELPDRASARSDVVRAFQAARGPAVEPPAPASPVIDPSEKSKAAPSAGQSARAVPKQRVPRGAKERRIEVQRRAPPKGRPSGEWVPRGP